MLFAGLHASQRLSNSAQSSPDSLSRQPDTVVHQDANRLLFDYSGLNDRGYTLTAARPAKGYFCWVSIDSGALHAKAKFGADFRAIADSIKPVQ